MSEKCINTMQGNIDAAEVAKPKLRPAKDRCTGCGVKFPKDVEEQDEDALEEYCDYSDEFICKF